MKIILILILILIFIVLYMKDIHNIYLYAINLKKNIY